MGLLKKRGRPAGSKNKTKLPDVYPKGSFEDVIKAWDEQDEQDRIDWELIAHKQEDRLTAYIAENEELARICVMRWEEIQHLKYLVSYLEGKHEDSSV